MKQVHNHDKCANFNLLLAAPQPPQVKIIEATTDSIILKLEPNELETAPIHGYTLHQKLDSGLLLTYEVAADAQNYTVKNLRCGSDHLLYATAYNK